MRKRVNDEESFEDSKARKSRGERGKSTEILVDAHLNAWKANDPTFDYDRLPDTRAAGRITPARVSDFTCFYAGWAFSLEVKETNDPRLAKSKAPQIPRMKRRAMAGVPGFIIIRHEQQWHLLDVVDLGASEKSWPLVDPIPDLKGVFHEILRRRAFRTHKNRGDNDRLAEGV